MLKNKKNLNNIIFQMRTEFILGQWTRNETKVAK